MRLDLSLNLLVNAAGGMLFVLAGAWALYVARGARRAKLVGWSSILFGATYVVQNLARDHDLVMAYGFSAIAFAATAWLVLLAGHLARDVPARARAKVVTLGAIAAAATLVVSVIAHAYPEAKISNGFRADVHGTIEQTAIAAILPAVTLLVGACAARFRSLDASATRERRALAAVAVGFGAFVVFFTTFISTLGTLLIDPKAATWAASSFAVIAVCTLLAAAGFLGNGADRRLGVRAFAFLLLAALAALLVNLARDPLDTDLGSFGIARTIGVAFLVVAIVRYDLLGTPLPHFAAKRGTLATGALATLLIVAQVAQNFLSAQYGLLMGGVVAGALVFAASPIQRALEGGGRGGTREAPPRQGENSYRKAVRLALRDRTLTREEETHLHELARDLGIDGPRAHAILGEVEAELAGGGRD